MTQILEAKQVEIPARDGFQLAASLYEPATANNDVVVINSATAVPRRFYRHFATALARAGNRVLTYDYRGIGESKPKSLRGFRASVDDWALKDMAGIVDWVHKHLAPRRLYFIGHSVGGQVAGLLDNAAGVDAMVTMSSQSGHWRMQGGEQKWTVWFHVHVTLPLLAHAFGYMPWSRISAAEDLPKAAALQWARWCRDRNYLLGDESLPLDRYRSFEAPVLAYSFGDDKWGTPRSVDAMMGAYPSMERRHVEPADAGLRSIGHFGFFRPESRGLWDDTLGWLAAR